MYLYPGIALYKGGTSPASDSLSYKRAIFPASASLPYKGATSLPVPIFVRQLGGFNGTSPVPVMHLPSLPPAMLCPFPDPASRLTCLGAHVGGSAGRWQGVLGDCCLVSHCWRSVYLRYSFTSHPWPWSYLQLSRHCRSLMEKKEHFVFIIEAHHSSFFSSSLFLFFLKIALFYSIASFLSSLRRRQKFPCYCSKTQSQIST